MLETSPDVIAFLVILIIKGQVGEGETLGLVILGSDKTHLTNNYGDKQDHCVYMTCGNIQKDIRTKLSSRLWVKIAQIPVGKFLEKEDNGVLNQRLYHICMDIVTEMLKECSREPVLMADAMGKLRLVRALLLAHIADHPEQQMIACAAGDASPISLARHKELGLDYCLDLRTRDVTLELVKELRDTPRVDPLNVGAYMRKAKKSGLNGVYEPYWRDWEFADPSKFLTPDVLHQFHKFFWDHPMKWARQLLGDAEIDRRYKVLQKHVGRKHFHNGFTVFSQHTGREYRELQASFIPVISGHKHITPGIMRAFRAILDFIYIGQFETHTSTTIRQLEDALVRFHAYKHHLSDAGVRDGTRRKGLFNIKKVELLHHDGRFIRTVGSLMQYSAEQTERCHITMAKAPYRATNHKDHEAQVCCILDRQEKLALFQLYIQYRLSASTSEVNASQPCVAHLADDGAHELEATPAIDSLSPFARSLLPKLIKDAFLDDESYTPRNETTAFILTSRINRGNAKISSISAIYELPKLDSFMLQRSVLRIDDRYQQVRPHIKYIDCWDRVRLQLRSQDNSNVVLQPITVMAAPPSDDLPFGLYNFVLVKDASNSKSQSIHGTFSYSPYHSIVHFTHDHSLIDHSVAQLRLIFQPVYSKLCSYQPEFLAYVEPLRVVHVPRQSKKGAAGCSVGINSGVIRVERIFDPDGSRAGMVISLTDIWKPVDLVPDYGEACPPHWTSGSASDFATQFFVNSFYDKQTYICLR